MFSCEFCEITKNTFFTKTLWTTASVNSWNVSVKDFIFKAELLKVALTCSKK